MNFIGFCILVAPGIYDIYDIIAVAAMPSSSTKSLVLMNPGTSDILTSLALL
jgi:hypothetical protein